MDALSALRVQYLYASTADIGVVGWSDGWSVYKYKLYQLIPLFVR